MVDIARGRHLSAKSLRGMGQFGRLVTAVAALVASPAMAQNPVSDATIDLSAYLVPASTASARPDDDGFIRRWLLLEPIVKPNRSNAGFTGSYVRNALAQTYFPGQMTIVPQNGQIVQAATPLTWHAYDAQRFDVKLFAFAQALGKPTYGVIFWAVTVIDSPKEQTVRMAVGSNSASMWWLNGEEALGLFDDRRMVMDDMVSRPLTLKKGRNVVRGAVINGPGLSDFCLRFIDDSEQPIRDLNIVTTGAAK
ncbi:hypothetical protein EV664_10682 [Stakelama pacifica]|uniref:Acetylxylan esterase n=2 Tax=Stakelama pacifica TaxID=517720 RepID=A0A4R6FL84_9SPHN|nr:hypothetical protein EV664_10682 [Stakelama pacifica]